MLSKGIALDFNSLGAGQQANNHDTDMPTAGGAGHHGQGSLRESYLPDGTRVSSLNRGDDEAARRQGTINLFKVAQRPVMR